MKRWVSFTVVFICGHLATGAENTNMPDFSGTFECPEYKKKDNAWNAHRSIIEQAKLASSLVISENVRGDVSNKTGPYTETFMVVDGKWRFEPFYRKNRVYPVKIKYTLEGSKIHWIAEYPAFVDNEGKSQPPKAGHGSFWRDKNGDSVSTASHYTGEYRCKVVKK